ncbi:hypothetical protein JW711_05580 [Candidatus Woesearchaeota archaeon]|nr:hypothetical protein [Candidatus Woesearchaeota archaeon]
MAGKTLSRVAMTGLASVVAGMMALGTPGVSASENQGAHEVESSQVQKQGFDDGKEKKSSKISLGASVIYDQNEAIDGTLDLGVALGSHVSLVASGLYGQGRRGSWSQTYPEVLDPIRSGGRMVLHDEIIDSLYNYDEKALLLGFDLGKKNGIRLVLQGGMGLYELRNQYTNTLVARTEDFEEVARQVTNGESHARDEWFIAVAKLGIPFWKRSDGSVIMSLEAGAVWKKYLCFPPGLKDEPLGAVVSLKYSK